MMNAKNREQLYCHFMVINVLGVCMIQFSDVAFAMVVQPDSTTSGMKGFDHYQDEHYKTILNEMKSKNIKENLRYFTEYPHHPGSKRNRELAEHIAVRWKKSGCDKTEIFREKVFHACNSNNSLMRYNRHD